ncbi:MAG: hypothetical protein WCB49_12985 [Gammaproteobacteria bacterium]
MLFRRTDLLEQHLHGRLEAVILAMVAFAQRLGHRHVDRAWSCLPTSPPPPSA